MLMNSGRVETQSSSSSRRAERTEFLERFATALDTDDFDTAAIHMEEDAVYDDGKRQSLVATRSSRHSVRGQSGAKVISTVISSYTKSTRGNPLRYASSTYCTAVKMKSRALIAALRVIYPPGARERLGCLIAARIKG